MSDFHCVKRMHTVYLKLSCIDANSQRWLKAPGFVYKSIEVLLHHRQAHAASFTRKEPIIAPKLTTNWSTLVNAAIKCSSSKPHRKIEIRKQYLVIPITDYNVRLLDSLVMTPLLGVYLNEYACIKRVSISIE